MLLLMAAATAAVAVEPSSSLFDYNKHRHILVMIMKAKRVLYMFMCILHALCLRPRLGPAADHRSEGGCALPVHVAHAHVSENARTASRHTPAPVLLIYPVPLARGYAAATFSTLLAPQVKEQQQQEEAADEAEDASEERASDDCVCHC
jgi:hypothetical protein